MCVGITALLHVVMKAPGFLHLVAPISTGPQSYPLDYLNMVRRCGNSESLEDCIGSSNRPGLGKVIITPTTFLWPDFSYVATQLARRWELWSMYARPRREKQFGKHPISGSHPYKNYNVYKVKHELLNGGIGKTDLWRFLVLFFIITLIFL